MHKFFVGHHWLLLAIFFHIPAEGLAQTVIRPPDDGVLQVPDVPIDVPKIGNPAEALKQGQPATRADEPVQLEDEDLKANSELASFILGKSVQAADWATVRRVLAYYTGIPGHDPLLALYARGALDRHDGRHGRAITAYRQMLRADGSLNYVQLDLAAMLFEDKQLTEARTLFELLRRDSDLVPTAQQAIDQYLAAIRKQNKWNGTVRLGYKYNDNVNNASADRYIYLFGLRFDKDPASLPRSANAISYLANLNRDFNLSGNHYLSVDGTIEGDRYWDDHAWSETNATLRLGYQYRNLKSWFSVMPSFGETWLGGDPFRRTVGASIEYGRWVTPKWQVIGNYSYFNKRYSGLYTIYDGDLHALSATAVYFASPQTILYGGVTVQRDMLETKYEASARDGASLGFIKQWNGGFNVRGNVRYSFRKFRDYSLWDTAKLRRDHEYQFDLSAMHSKLRFADVYPRLSYQHLRVDSSISSLYSRTGNQFTLSLETSF